VHQMMSMGLDVTVSIQGKEVIVMKMALANFLSVISHPGARTLRSARVTLLG
jgi:hypothetical protein